MSNGGGGGLSLMEGAVLDMIAEGKSPRAIAEVMGISPAEAAKMAYELLDREIVTDVEQRRKLQTYRLEKIVEALWQRVMNNANKDDVKNLVDVLDKLNVLLGLNKEVDAAHRKMMETHQAQMYLFAIQALIEAFRALNPGLKTADEWAEWTAQQMEDAIVILEREPDRKELEEGSKK